MVFRLLVRLNIVGLDNGSRGVPDGIFTLESFRLSKGGSSKSEIIKNEGLRSYTVVMCV